MVPTVMLRLPRIPRYGRAATAVTAHPPASSRFKIPNTVIWKPCFVLFDPPRCRLYSMMCMIGRLGSHHGLIQDARVLKPMSRRLHVHVPICNPLRLFAACILWPRLLVLGKMSSLETPSELWRSSRTLGWLRALPILTLCLARHRHGSGQSRLLRNGSSIPNRALA